MKNWITIYLFIAVVVALLTACAGPDKVFPVKQDGPPADLIARNISASVNCAAWANTGAVSWEFPGGHKHLWDKNRSLAMVEWKKFKVIFDIGTKEGRAWKNGEEVSGDDLKELIEKAWHYWANDSFWLNPLCKLFDDGVERNLVQTKDDRRALMVTYTAGGNTPGDSYLWIVDENDKPIRMRMWVQILPLKGIGTSWEDWLELPTGALVAQSHKAGFINLKLKNIKSAATLHDLMEEDPFLPLYENQDGV